MSAKGLGKPGKATASWFCVASHDVFWGSTWLTVHSPKDATEDGIMCIHELQFVVQSYLTVGNLSSVISPPLSGAAVAAYARQYTLAYGAGAADDDSSGTPT